ncbi:pseudouridine synthase [Candidatus Oleimmundimicrobium sp.]|uniref:pseudouridine synthase n=1 Tax=Candidatus Oleimmundimicrobium sp. TaxID=3060597 RepID=UPI002720F47C|nr:pseudouridine synthase [Candidatus Oleimmundimicrobium sp.]MDO8886104.1 pseudouridine synthase [Candidatus Oleimmundimicrobium sp.]
MESKETKRKKSFQIPTNDSRIDRHLQRLQKVMAEAGVASRRKCEKLIAEGKVRVNGEIVKELGFKVNPSKDVIDIEGKILKIPEKIYLMLNKPVGYLTSVSDPFNRPTVMDLVKEKARVFPVGRLDKETEGLLIFTNNGELAHRLMHPSFKFKKTYVAEIDGYPTEESLTKLRKGVELDDGITYLAEVKLLKKRTKNSVIEISISEGRKRQVRRMFKAIGHNIIKLKRINYGPLSVEGLKLGEYRYLTDTEVKLLKKEINLESKEEIL